MVFGIPARNRRRQETTARAGKVPPHLAQGNPLPSLKEDTRL